MMEYANSLQNLWQELNHYRVFEMKCANDAVTLKTFIEKDQVYDFLAGLHFEFDQVRIRILGKEEIPSLGRRKSKGNNARALSYGRLSISNSQCVNTRKRKGGCFEAYMEG